MSNPVQITTTITVTLTAKDLAEAFKAMDVAEKAAFMCEISGSMSTWGAEQIGRSIREISNGQLVRATFREILNGMNG